MIRLLEHRRLVRPDREPGDLTIETLNGGNVQVLGDFVNQGTVHVTAPFLVFLPQYYTSPPGASSTCRRAIEVAASVWFLGGGLDWRSTGDSGPLLRNDGQIRLAGNLTVNAKLDNLGTIEISGITTFQGIRGQDLGEGLSGMTGTWIVRNGAEFRSNPTFNAIAGSVQLEGPGSVLAAANLIRHITGSLTLGDGRLGHLHLPTRPTRGQSP